MEISFYWHPSGLNLTPAEDAWNPAGAGEGPGAGLGISYAASDDLGICAGRLWAESLCILIESWIMLSSIARH